MALTADQALPRLIDVDVFELAVSQTNWDTISIDTGVLLNASKQSTNAVDNEIGFDVVLAAGTWTFELLHTMNSGNGIYSIQFDGVQKGVIDGYASTWTTNVLSSVTAISVPTSGVVRIKLKMSTKNASSSGYAGIIQHIQLRRTA
jgi:hypothetical protein